MQTTYLDENTNFDFSSDAIQNLIKTIENNISDDTPLDFALKAYYYTRDTWPYNPYRFSLIENDWRASKPQFDIRI